jgi:hypothetical protein
LADQAFLMITGAGRPGLVLELTHNGITEEKDLSQVINLDSFLMCSPMCQSPRQSGGLCALDLVPV